MFGWEFPPHNSGGLGVACQGLARALAEKNIELTFVLPKKIDIDEPSVKFAFANVPNLSMVEIDSLLKAYLTSGTYKLLRESEDGIDDMYGSTLLEEVKRYSALARGIARNYRHDIIHAHDWLAYGAGIQAKKVSGKPFFAHIHATEVDRTAGNPNMAIYKREREGLEAADRILAVSKFTKDTLHKHYGIKEDKVDVVYNGIEPKKYEHAGIDPSGINNLKKLGYKVVLFVGRITIMKGVDYLMEAARQVLKHNPKTVFVIAGAGDMEAQIMNMAAELKISDKVVFAGFLRGDDLSSAYRSADVFVMPSVSEPFGLVALEALVHDAPVIVSKQSGVSELLSNVMKVDFWDTEELADKILSVTTHPSLKHELSSNGTREAHMCNWGNVADRCIHSYQKLL